MTNVIAWKAGLALATLFGLGVASGFVVARRTAPRPEPQVITVRAPLNPTNAVQRTDQLTKRWRENRLNNYLRIIRPTADQQAAIHKHFDALADEQARIQSGTRKELQQAIQQMQKNIAAELTPSQRQAFLDHLRKAERREEKAP